MIKNPGIGIERLSIESAPQGKRVAPDAVQNFLTFYGLQKKLRIHSHETAQGIRGQTDCRHPTRADVLFPEKQMSSFYPEIQNCPDCNTRLHVQKATGPKTVATMDIGAFSARETVLYCPNGHGTFRSKQLRSLVPKGDTFGFDIIIKVGVALFVRSRSNLEVIAELAARNVFVSEREISFLARKVIIYLALAHRQSRPALRKFLTAGGGYILHVDGTCEGDSPNLFCGLDGLSELVLDAVKIASEKKDKLVTFFRSIKDQYGEPRALVHDMGKGIVNAVEEVFPGTPDFICHFHFLRDIGKDLLADEYWYFQKRLWKLKIRSACWNKLWTSTSAALHPQTELFPNYTKWSQKP